METFKKDSSKRKPEISTASLPDIIFILLFFFMVVTVMRKEEVKVITRLPSATELTKLERKSLVDHVYIGSPINKYKYDGSIIPRIQLGDQFAHLNDVQPFVVGRRANKSEIEKDATIFSLRIDKEVKMGIVSDVKMELRKVGALKINYSALPEATEE